MALTKAQRARLDKLATYLEGLPKRYRHFDMEHYIQSNGRFQALRQYARKNGGVASCGTAACAIGHGPAAGVPVPLECISGSYIRWYEYAELFVGNGWFDDVDRNRLFEWLFGSSWKHEDNTHWGAAARIRYVLEHDEPPKGGMRRTKPLYAPYRIDAKAKADA